MSESEGNCQFKKTYQKSRRRIQCDTRGMRGITQALLRKHCGLIRIRVGVSRSVRECRGFSIKSQGEVDVGCKEVFRDNHVDENPIDCERCS